MHSPKRRNYELFPWSNVCHNNRYIYPIYPSFCPIVEYSISETKCSKGHNPEGFWLQIQDRAKQLADFGEFVLHAMLRVDCFQGLPKRYKMQTETAMMQDAMTDSQVLKHIRDQYEDFQSQRRVEEDNVAFAANQTVYEQ